MRIEVGVGWIFGGGGQRCGHLLGGLDAQFAQVLGAADEVAAAVAKLTQCGTVGFVGTSQCVAHGQEILGKTDELVVQCAALTGDFECVAVLIVAPPEVVDNLEDGEQIGRVAENHLLAVGVVPQLRVVLEGGQKGGLGRDEHDDEVGRGGGQTLVALAGQLVDVFAYRGDVGRKGRFAGYFVAQVGGFGVLGVGGERHLRVDDHLLVAGQVEYHVGADVVPLFGAKILLDVEVDAAFQTRTLEQRLEDHLAPVTLCLTVAAQGGGQVVGLAAHLVAHLVEPFDLGFEHFALGGLLFNPLAEPFDVLAQRTEQLADVLLVGVGETAGLLLQNVVGQVAEVVGKLFLQLLPLGGLGLETFRPDADLGLCRCQTLFGLGLCCGHPFVGFGLLGVLPFDAQGGRLIGTLQGGGAFGAVAYPQGGDGGYEQEQDDENQNIVHGVWLGIRLWWVIGWADARRGRSYSGGVVLVPGGSSMVRAAEHAGWGAGTLTHGVEAD